MKNTALHYFVLFLICSQAYAQSAETNLSLKECLSTALVSSQSVRNARLDIRKAESRKREATAPLLPKLDAYGTYDNYLKIPVQMVPGEIFGQPGTTIPISLYVQHNASGGLRATQLLYDQTVYSALALADKANEISGLQMESAKNDIIYEISRLYFLIKVTEGQRVIYDRNLQRIDTLLAITKSLLGEGFVRNVDLERIMVNRGNLLTEINDLENLYSEQLSLLRHTIGLPPNSTETLGKGKFDLRLTDSLGLPLLDFSNKPDGSNESAIRNELSLLQKNKEIAVISRDMASRYYYPIISLYGQYYYQAQREKFDFMKSGEKKWFDVGIVGASISIPLFDGFLKSSQRDQAEIDILQIENNYEFSKDQFSIEYQNAIRKYQTNESAEQQQRANIVLAENVYRHSLQQYQNGILPLTDLLDSENSLSNTHLSWMNVLFQLRVSELDVLKSAGTLQSILSKKLK